MIVRSFAPIVAPDARILILGSMPGIASLEAGQYYAHPRNAFWTIMGALFSAGPDLPYTTRVARLQARGVAVWDVLKLCVRKGSLDSRIRDEVPNDFAAFFAEHYAIDRVLFNGVKSATSFRRHVAHLRPHSAQMVTVPSTSPAHATRNFEQKLDLWRAALAG